MTRQGLEASDWEERYRAADTPWDLGGPTPVFTRLLREGTLPAGRLLIPGAGRGYDALAFAQEGFEVTTLDVSASACEAVRQAAQEANLEVRVLQGDFFTYQPEAPYDAMLEYTFYCAIDPALRAAYHEQAARLIRPGGLLVGLFFPLRAPGLDPGPPFPVDPDRLRGELSQAFELVHDSLPPDSIRPRAGNERLMIARRVSGPRAGA